MHWVYVLRFAPPLPQWKTTHVEQCKDTVWLSWHEVLYSKTGPLGLPAPRLYPRSGLGPRTRPGLHRPTLLAGACSMDPRVSLPTRGVSRPDLEQHRAGICCMQLACGAPRTCSALVRASVQQAQRGLASRPAHDRRPSAGQAPSPAFDQAAQEPRSVQCSLQCRNRYAKLFQSSTSSSAFTASGPGLWEHDEEEPSR